MVATACSQIKVIPCSQNALRVKALVQGHDKQASFRSMETLKVAQRHQ